MVRRKNAAESPNDSAVALAEPPSFRTIARKRLGDRLKRYRDLVARAAVGTLSESELSEAADLVSAMGYKLDQWERDVSAWRDYERVREDLSNERKAAPTKAERARQLVEKIQVISDELKSARHELYIATTLYEQTAVALARQVNEHAEKSPHLFQELELAVTLQDSGLSGNNRATVGWH